MKLQTLRNKGKDIDPPPKSAVLRSLIPSPTHTTTAVLIQKKSCLHRSDKAIGTPRSGGYVVLGYMVGPHAIGELSRLKKSEDERINP
jgi:hypothetical protein